MLKSLDTQTLVKCSQAHSSSTQPHLIFSAQKLSVVLYHSLLHISLAEYKSTKFICQIHLCLHEICMFISITHMHVHVLCGESWLAIKDLQPTVPVLKAGHPVHVLL